MSWIHLEVPGQTSVALRELGMIDSSPLTTSFVNMPMRFSKAVSNANLNALVTEPSFSWRMKLERILLNKLLGRPNRHGGVDQGLRHQQWLASAWRLTLPRRHRRPEELREKENSRLEVALGDVPSWFLSCYWCAPCSGTLCSAEIRGLYARIRPRFRRIFANIRE